jgi:hypothetical protein
MKFLEPFKAVSAFLILVALPTSVLAVFQLHFLDRFPPEKSTDSVIAWKVRQPMFFVSKSFQCATFSVPIDQDSDRGELFNMDLVKLPAAATKSTSPKLGDFFR